MKLIVKSASLQAASLTHFEADSYSKVETRFWTFIGRCTRRKMTILTGLHGYVGGTVQDQCGQATKGTRWMTWHTEAKKDGVASEMLRGVGKQTVIRRYLNAATHFTAA